MGGSKQKKPKGVGGGATSPVAATMAADLARRRSKSAKRTNFPWQTSVLVLLVAIGATVLLTRSPPAPSASPRVPSKAASYDEHFTPQDRIAQCESWANDKECENNPDFMLERCPSTCKTRQAVKSRRSPPKAEKTKPKKDGPKDNDANCAVWAASGECENNPAFMLKECAASCAGESDDEGVDLHQDCEPWVKDGECYRNPAFMLQQCKASCAKFAAANDNILQDTSDTCVNFALRGGCLSDPKKATSTCRASCHIQRICANHTETVTCSKALRCEAIGDHKHDCAARAAAGECESNAIVMLKECLKSCSEIDLDGMMRFHLPHERTTLSPWIDLPAQPPRLAGFYQTPPQSTNADADAKALCPASQGQSGFARRLARYREAALVRQRWGRFHWSRFDRRPGHERTPRVPHLFKRVPAVDGESRMVVVEHVAYTPRIRYLHRLLTAAECEHILKISQPLFARSPVRGSVTRVRTSTTAMLGGRHDDAIVTAVRQRIARFSGYDVDLLEPLQVGSRSLPPPSFARVRPRS